MALIKFLLKPDILKHPFNYFNRITYFKPLFNFTPKNNVIVSMRNMSGHKRTMEILPSSYDWTKFKDHMHFYAMLFAIPIGAFITIVNVVYGPAELADIPEGYEPKHWEYYKHPISQWIARYIVVSPEKTYEKNLHFLAAEQDKIRMRALEEKVKILLNSDNDLIGYRKWYYLPRQDVKYVEDQRDKKERVELEKRFTHIIRD